MTLGERFAYRSRMARIGGRAAGWAVAAVLAGTGALLIAGGLTPDDADLRSAAVDAAAPGTDARTPGSAAPADSSSSSTSPGAVAPGTTSVPAPGSGPSSEAPPSPAPSSGSAAAGPPAPSAAEPGPAPSDYPTYAAATAEAAFVSFIGDSWTEGTGASDEAGYAYVTGRMLGWTHRVLGVGGSGYVQPGSGAPFDERVLPAVSGDPDVVVIQGSVNERNTPVDQLAPAVAGTLDRLVRAAGPDTAVLVLGASYVPGADDEDVDRVNDVVRAEAARQGVPFVDVAAENWTDPADPAIWADPLHVNDLGARQIAERLAPVLRSVVAG
jgi:lysophospholipase L1-like esterase